MTTTAIQVPAGWYPDPLAQTVNGESTHRRWWDGGQWTDHVEPLRRDTVPNSPEVSTGAIRAARQYDAEQQAKKRSAGPRHSANQMATPGSTYTATSSPPVTLTPGESADAARHMSLHSVSAESAPSANEFYASWHSDSTVAKAEALKPTRTRVNTTSVWLIATMPLTQAILVFLVFASLPPENSTWVRALAVVFPLILCAALAVQDTRLMARAGHLNTAPWATALVAPVLYLAVRGVRIARTTGAFAWPAVVWLLAQAAVLAVWWTVDPAGVSAVLEILL